MNWNAILMTQHFLFVAILITLTRLISLEEAVATVSESALLGGFLASSIGIIWEKKKTYHLHKASIQRAHILHCSQS